METPENIILPASVADEFRKLAERKPEEFTAADVPDTIVGMNTAMMIQSALLGKALGYRKATRTRAEAKKIAKRRAKK